MLAVADCLNVAIAASARSAAVKLRDGPAAGLLEGAAVSVATCCATSKSSHEKVSDPAAVPDRFIARGAHCQGLDLTQLDPAQLLSCMQQQQTTATNADLVANRTELCLETAT